MTAFITPFGLYEFTVMLFGLTNAPSVFQSMMNKVISPLLYKGVMVYLDDILIYSHTKEEHLAKLRQVFQLLADNKLYVCLEKCKFLLPELPFLGHFVTPDGLQPDPKKLVALETMLPPRNVKEAQSFVGFVNYFRRFVPKCSLIMRPIITEIKSGAAFQQTPALLEAFHAAISALKSATALKLPDFTKPFELVTDASKHHVGGILVQEGRPVAFESSLLNATQQNWPTHDRELFALVYFVPLAAAPAAPAAAAAVPATAAIAAAGVGACSICKTAAGVRAKTTRGALPAGSSTARTRPAAELPPPPPPPSAAASEQRSGSAQEEEEEPAAAAAALLLPSSPSSISKSREHETLPCSGKVAAWSRAMAAAC